MGKRFEEKEPSSLPMYSQLYPLSERSGIGASPEGERFREAAFEMALLCHSGRGTNTVLCE